MMKKIKKIKKIGLVFKKSFQKWNQDDAFRLSASISYMAIFSLPALLIIVINIAGALYGEEAIQGQISNEVQSMLGKEAARNIEVIIGNAKQSENTVLSTVISIAILLFGATGVFFYLQKSLNEVWNVRPEPKSNLLLMLKIRAFSLGIVLAIGFLLLISLIITAFLSAFSNWLQDKIPDFFLYIFYVLNFLISLGLITVLFALIYKILPDVKVTWKTVWRGGAITALLFVIGKFLLGIYFGNLDPASAYGAAGSLVLILLWVYYSSLILLYGAEFTYFYAKEYGHPIEPAKYAVSIEDKNKPGNKQ